MSEHSANPPAHTEKKPSFKGGFFITGTDTEIGKSFVSGCIAKSLLAAGFEVLPRKPIASGCIKQADGSLLSEDALFLQQSSQTHLSLREICNYQFEAPISPQRAIASSDTIINIADLAAACRLSDAVDKQITLVEGAGGFYSPLALDGLNADLAERLQLPVILVVGNRLGCINQALLSIEAIGNRGLHIHCIVVNDISADADIDNFTDLQSLTDIPVLHNSYNENKEALPLSGFSI
ncbi:dethiobiotin synthase [Thiomicrorhabdus sediminis]|uniref:ATP-dependent dethiobiotin synthetase BioD n=2 Tax=Thiomicrorhabdus sediminis TaxID=2580412 RepID=A0A4P9K7J4_9GAMM|nr:dethiobiotin synthase [Thiomicrorhabdus sediminis]